MIVKSSQFFVSNSIQYPPNHLPLEPPADPGEHLLLLLVGEGGGVEHVPAEVLLGHVLLHTAVPADTTTVS